MRPIILIITFILILAACQQTQRKFDRLSWTEKVDGFYIQREYIVNDLMKHHLHHGMPYHAVVKMLGEPDIHMNFLQHEISYNISLDYGSDIDPVESKDLYMQFSIDSTLMGYEIKDWKK
jgi:hypothetical protein